MVKESIVSKGLTIAKKMGIDFAPQSCHTLKIIYRDDIDTLARAYTFYMMDGVTRSYVELKPQILALSNREITYVLVHELSHIKVGVDHDHDQVFAKAMAEGLFIAKVGSISEIEKENIERLNFQSFGFAYRANGCLLKKAYI